MRDRTTPNPIDEHIGGRLRRLRHERGLSQSDLAGQLGMSVAQPIAIEDGVKRLDAGLLMASARVLDVHIADFYEDMPMLVAWQHRPRPH